MVYLDQDEHSHTKSDHYLAQIAAEIRMGNMHLMFKEKQAADMLLNFTSAEDQKMIVQQSKSIWGMALGVDTNPQNN